MGPISELIGANKYLLSLRDGFMLAFPATMFGSIMVILQNLPTTFGFGGFLPKWFNTFLTDFFGPVGNATMSVSALFIVFGIGYQLAGHSNIVIMAITKQGDDIKSITYMKPNQEVIAGKSVVGDIDYLADAAKTALA